MKNKIPFQAGTARLIYKAGEAPSGGATETKEKKEGPSIGDLAAEIQGGIVREAEEKGVEIDYEALSADPNKLCDVIERVSEAFGGVMDKIAAIFAPLGVARSSIDALLKGAPGSATREQPVGLVGKEPTENGEEFDEWDYERARNAKKMLRENPTWAAEIERASKEHGVPTSTITAFIQMESDFNPHARPINRKTGKTLSSALGFSQMIDDTFAAYRRDALKRGRPAPDRENPTDAIDMVAWYCKQLVAEVRLLRPEPKYLLDVNNTPHLYLAYHEGPTGYLALRRYMDALADPNMSEERREAYYELLTDTQKDSRSAAPAWQVARDYAARVANVARAFDYIKNRDETAEAAPDPQLDSPPLRGGIRITSRFGQRTHPTEGHEHDHNGCDYGAKAGTPVLAVKDAVVQSVGFDTVSGNFIVLKLKNGFEASYCHFQEPAARESGRLKKGESVSSGEQIGKVGSTGRSTGPHLHFGLKYGGRRVDPEPAVVASLDRRARAGVA